MEVEHDAEEMSFRTHVPDKMHTQQACVKIVDFSEVGEVCHHHQTTQKDMLNPSLGDNSRDMSTSTYSQETLRHTAPIWHLSSGRAGAFHGQSLLLRLVGRHSTDFVHFELDDGSLLCGQRGSIMESCSYFHAMFESGMTESQTARVYIQGFSAACITAFLVWAHTRDMDTVSFEQVDGRELWAFSHMYDVHGLREALLHGLCHVNVCSAAAFALDILERHNEPALLAACVQAAQIPGCLKSVSVNALIGVGDEAVRPLLRGHAQVKQTGGTNLGIEALQFVDKWWEANKGSHGASEEMARSLAREVDLTCMGSKDLREWADKSWLVERTMADKIIHERRNGGQGWGRFCEFEEKDCFGSVGNARVPLRFPRHIAVFEDGSFVVADKGNSRVLVFNPDGSTACSMGTRGSGEGQLVDPESVAVGRQGHIFVTDSALDRVQMFTRCGTFVRAFGTRGHAHGELARPSGVAVSAADEVFVCDLLNHRVQVFSSQGVFLRAFGSHGTAPGQFALPQAIAINPLDGNVLISDLNAATGTGRVQVLTPQGAFVRMFGDHLLGDPEGLSVSPGGDVVVADKAAKCIIIFDGSGQVLRHVGTQGCAPLQFRCPFGAAVTTDGRILVSDFSRHCIKVLVPEAI